MVLGSSVFFFEGGGRGGGLAFQGLGCGSQGYGFGGLRA